MLVYKPNVQDSVVIKVAKAQKLLEESLTELMHEMTQKQVYFARQGDKDTSDAWQQKADKVKMSKTMLENWYTSIVNL